MAEWESSYGGMFLHNARILTSDEIAQRYPLRSNSRMARLTREAVEKGWDIFYGENPNLNWDNCIGYNWSKDVTVTAAYLYKTQPDRIIIGNYTDMSEVNAIYAAVKVR